MSDEKQVNGSDWREWINAEEKSKHDSSVAAPNHVDATLSAKESSAVADQDVKQDEFHVRERSYEERSGGQMLMEIGRLLLVLLWKLLRVLWKLTQKMLKWLLKLVCKGLLLLIDGTSYAAKRTREFWNDKDTQEKLRITKEIALFWLKRVGQWLWGGLILTGKGLRWFVIHLWVWTLWLGRKLIEGVIHLRPTVQKAGQTIVTGIRALWRWVCRCGRQLRRWNMRRRIAYRRFRQNKGFRGLLIDVGNGLKRSVNNLMEEDQSEGIARNREDLFSLSQNNEQSESVAVIDKYTDESTTVDTSGQNEDTSSSSSLARSWGSRIYKAMRRITEA